MSALQKAVEDGIKAQLGEGAAIDIGSIIAIVTTLLGFIQKCRNPAKVRRYIKEGGTMAKVTAYRAVRKAGFDGHQVDLMLSLVNSGVEASDDEIAETYEMAMDMPFDGDQS